MGVDGVVDFETAADPIDEFLFALLNGRFCGIMNAGEADAFFHEGIELLEVIVLEGGMAATAVCVNDYAIGSIERIGIRRPAVAIDDGGYAWNFIEAGFEQEATGAMFVVAGTVARATGDENDFF